MGTRKKPDSDENAELTAAAQRRAAVQSWLNNNPGKHKVDDICAGLGIDPKDDKERKLVAWTCKQLMTNEIIKGGKEGVANWYASMDTQVNGEVQQVRQKRVAKGTVANAEEVEIVFGRIIVGLGRNPENGKLRITLEQA